MFNICSSHSPHTIFVTWAMSTTHLAIIYTIDELLTIYHPLVPWLVLWQSDHTQLWIGQHITVENVYGPTFAERPIYGCIWEVSHFMKGFVIVIVAMDPPSFRSAIYLAIPHSWFALGPLLSLTYRLSFCSLSPPRFIHYLDPSHVVYVTDCLWESPEGSRLYRRSRWCHWDSLFSPSQCLSCPLSTYTASMVQSFSCQVPHMVQDMLSQHTLTGKAMHVKSCLTLGMTGWEGFGMYFCYWMCFIWYSLLFLTHCQPWDFWVLCTLKPLFFVSHVCQLFIFLPLTVALLYFIFTYTASFLEYKYLPFVPRKSKLYVDSYFFPRIHL